jgi:hypothetical protein|tara:strand:- start:152 stop:349 length:198 start_codon:yes stop_codon:yes gene_type:complete
MPLFECFCFDFWKLSTYSNRSRRALSWAGLDLSRDFAAPLTTYRTAKENADGITNEQLPENRTVM